MADLHAEIAEYLNSPEQKRVRDARKLARTEFLESLNLREALKREAAPKFSVNEHGEANEQDRLIETGMHPGHSAMILAQEALSEYHLNGDVNLRFVGMHRESGKGAHQISEGSIMIEAQLKGVTGMTSTFNIPVIVRKGRMSFPCVVITQDGLPRVMAQSTFDDLIGHSRIDQDEVANMRPDKQKKPFQGLFARLERQEEKRAELKALLGKRY